MTPRNGKKGKVTEMGCLWERTCGHCKNLFEAVTVGVCEVTDHRVEKTGDDEFAKSCPHYENKWGMLTKEKVQAGSNSWMKRSAEHLTSLRKSSGKMQNWKMVMNL